MTSGRFAPVALAALLVLAGCAAPVGNAPVAPGGGSAAVDGPDDGATADANDPPDDTDWQSAAPDGVVVQNGHLDVNANRTFERTQTLLGAEFAGTTVTVRDLSAYKSADVSSVAFFRLFGVANPSLDPDQPAGLTTLTGSVYVSPAGATPQRVEQVLAHEFVHVAQVRTEMVPWFGGFSLSTVPLDERLAHGALVEGGAVYATDAYTREHLPNATLQSERIAAQYANGSSGDRLSLGQYRFGARYVNATVDNPTELASVYDDAPDTTEAVLHPDVREKPVALDVDAETENHRRVRSLTGRAGELVTRIVLRDLVARERAVAASEGWGNDRVVLFEPTDAGATSWVEQSAAWVTRWDSATDADEFAAVARNASWTDNPGYAYRTVRVDDRTVVVLAGGERFVANATVSGNVTVTA
ncbi:hypothetical protein [Halobacterium zhouii]|uniref:hypothetical protein n=1 Tax=Halobacterium zhouii TaxID=2902624 RepID=UPI001E61004C|nr:hypothetical protein [Halobacterium zhouii]